MPRASSSAALAVGHGERSHADVSPPTGFTNGTTPSVAVAATVMKYAMRRYHTWSHAASCARLRTTALSRVSIAGATGGSDMGRSKMALPSVTAYRAGKVIGA